MAVDYTKSAAESIAEYNTRTKAAQTDTSGGDDFMSTLQKSLLNNQAVSSQDTGIETMINDSISKLQQGNDASKGAIDSAFERQKGYTEQGQQRNRTSQLERGGGTTSVVTLKAMDEIDRREIADLESRKQELILQGDATTAKEISGLIIQKYQFRNQAQQQVFSNLLSMGNFGMQVQQEKRMAQTQSFAEQSAINSIALKYGLKIDKGETLDTITAKASPFASEEQQLEIKKTKAEIAKANAEAAKALKGDTSNAVDPLTIDIMATAALKDPLVLGQIKDPLQLAKVRNRMEEINKPREFKSEEFSAMITGAGDRSKAMAGVAADPRIKNKQVGYDLIDKIYPADAPHTFTKDVGSIWGGIGDAGYGVGQYFGAFPQD
jgi:hypothetical protein